MARRLEEMKLLNMDRWKAHLQERADRDREVAEERQIASQQQIAGAVSPLPLPSATVSAPSAGVARMHPTPVPTAGELFNRPDPLHRGRLVKPHSREEGAPEPEYRTRRMWVSPRDYRRVDKPAQPGAWMETRQAVPTSGDDFTSVPLFSPFKYRVPVTSVTRKQGDCKLFLCCGWRWTAVSCAALKSPFASHETPYAYSHRMCPVLGPSFPASAPLAHQQAQWIWLLNLVCCIAHTAMIFVTYHFAYWRHDLDPMEETAHVLIPIYRIRNIPTQHMLDTNQSRWSEGWNLTSTELNSGLFLHDNGMPVRLDPNTRSG